MEWVGGGGVRQSNKDRGGAWKGCGTFAGQSYTQCTEKAMKAV